MAKTVFVDVRMVLEVEVDDNVKRGELQQAVDNQVVPYLTNALTLRAHLKTSGRAEILSVDADALEHPVGVDPRV